MGTIPSKQSRTKERETTGFTKPSVSISSEHLMRKTYPLFAVRQIANAYAARAQAACPAECNPTMPLLYALGKSYFFRVRQRHALQSSICSHLLMPCCFLSKPVPGRGGQLPIVVKHTHKKRKSLTRGEIRRYIGLASETVQRRLSS